MKLKTIIVIIQNEKKMYTTLKIETIFSLENNIVLE